MGSVWSEDEDEHEDEETEAEAEVEVEAEVRTAALAPARRPLRAARPLADAASAAELRVPLPLLQIKGPKPSRLHKSVAMHVAVPDGPVKLKPRDASVSAEGDRWLPSYPHAIPCCCTPRTHHAHARRAHTTRTHDADTTSTTACTRACAPFCQAHAAHGAQAEAVAGSGGCEGAARGAAAAPRPVARAVAAPGHRDVIHRWGLGLGLGLG